MVMQSCAGYSEAGPALFIETASHKSIDRTAAKVNAELRESNSIYSFLFSVYYWEVLLRKNSKAWNASDQ